MQRLRVLLLGLVLVAVLILGAVTGLVASRFFFPRSRPAPPNTATILTQIQPLAQLVTVKYVMEKVVVLEDVRLYGENRVLLVAHGIVKAGVDLGRLTPQDVRPDGARVRVRLPTAAITDAYLDEQKTQVLEHSTGLLRRFDKDLQQQARAQGLDDIRRAARNHGILEDANERARLQLRTLLLQLGFSEVEFEGP